MDIYQKVLPSGVPKQITQSQMTWTIDQKIGLLPQEQLPKYISFGQFIVGSQFDGRVIYARDVDLEDVFDLRGRTNPITKEIN